MREGVKLYQHSIFYPVTNSWGSDISDKEIFEKALAFALDNNAKFMVLVAIYNLHGKGCKSSFSDFNYWLNKAVETNDADALTLIAEGYQKGWFNQKSNKIAEEYLKKILDLNYIKGTYMYGCYYLEIYFQTMRKEHLERSMYYFCEGMRQGHVISLLMYCYYAKRNMFSRRLYMVLNYLKNYGAIISLENEIKWWRYADLVISWPRVVGYINKKL